MRCKARFWRVTIFFEMSKHSFPNHKYHKSSKGQLMSCKLKVKHDAGHNLDSGKTLQNIYCLWTNVAEIWPTYFEINFLKNRFWEFWVLFSVLVIFFPSCADDLLFLALSAYTLYQKKKPLDKSLKHSLLAKHVKKQMRS